MLFIFVKVVSIKFVLKVLSFPKGFLFNDINLGSIPLIPLSGQECYIK